MAAIKSVDHKGMEFPSFKAMCEHWEKKPATVRRRLENNFRNFPLEMALKMALEIPAVPGYKYNLVIIGLDNQPRFSVAINPKYKQHEKFDTKQTSKHGIGKLYTLEQIRNNFPMTMKQFKKGRLLGIY